MDHVNRRGQDENETRQSWMAEAAERAATRTKDISTLRNRYWSWLKQLEPTAIGHAARFIIDNRQLSDESMRPSLERLAKLVGTDTPSSPKE